MKLQIIKKAYLVKDTTIEWQHGDSPDDNWEDVYATSSGQAKQMCSEQNSFITVKCKRDKGRDIVLFEGYETKRWQMLETIKEKKRIKQRLKKILKFPESEMFYVQKGYVGNSCLFWALGNAGYTCDLDKAQQYTRQQILDDFVKRSDENKIWCSSHVLQNVKKHVDSQYLNYKFVA